VAFAPPWRPSPDSLSILPCRNFSLSHASGTGWGASCQGRSTGGLWTAQETALHINVLELRAARFALACFAGSMHGREILLRIDNTTALAYINKMGGIHSALPSTKKAGGYGSGASPVPSSFLPPTSLPGNIPRPTGFPPIRRQHGVGTLR